MSCASEILFSWVYFFLNAVKSWRLFLQPALTVLRNEVNLILLFRVSLIPDGILRCYSLFTKNAIGCFLIKQLPKILCVLGGLSKCYIAPSPKWLRTKSFADSFCRLLLMCNANAAA